MKTQTAHLDTTTRLQVENSCNTGAWLTLLPDRLNATELSAEEFRDSLRIRFNLKPQALPDRCDGCDLPFTVRHAMSCKKGGLILLRHNSISAEWQHL